MKKVLSIILSVFLLMSMLPSATLTAAAENYDVFSYSVSNGEVTITECDENAGGEIIIPDEIDGYPVTQIRFGAFMDCVKITGINFPKSLEKMDLSFWDFKSCKALKAINVDEDNEVYSSIDGVLFNKEKTRIYFCPPGKYGEYVIPDGVTAIDGAFDGSILESITIPKSLIDISCDGNFAGTDLYKCEKLKAINVDDDNEVYSSVGGVLFNKAKTEILQFPLGRGGEEILPDCTAKIGKGAFYCSKVSKIVIPSSVQIISDYAFFSCCELIGLIPEGVIEIGVQAFDGCVKLKSVTVPGTVREFGGYVFANCSELTDVTLSNGLTEIPSFYCCGKLKKIIVPEGVTTISSSNFWEDNLESITIPASVTAIGSSAFMFCDNLTIYGISGSYAEIYANNNNFSFIAINNIKEKTIVLKKEQKQAYVDGQILPMTDYGNGNYAMAKSVNGSYALPIRCIGEAFNMRVDYLGSGKTKITNSAGDYVVVLRDSNVLEKYDVNNNLINSFTADFAAYTEAGITYVPMRAVSEALGLGVSYVGSGTTGHGSYVAVSTDILLNLKQEEVLAEIEKAYALGL